MKRGGKLLLLAAALAVLAGCWLLVKNLTGREKEEPDASFQMTSLDKAALEFLGVEYQGETYTLASDGSSWSMDGDGSFTVKQAAAEAVAAAACSLTASSKLDTPMEPSVYGLDEPSLKLTMTFADGSVTELEVGNVNSVTGEYYASTDAGTTVCTISSSSQSSLAATKKSLLQYETIPDCGTVRSVVITGADRDIAIRRIEDGAPYTSAYEWFASGNTETPLAADAVEQIITAAKELVFKDCVAWDAQGEALAAYGLDNPEETVTVSGDEGGFTLEFGDTGEDGTYVRLAKSSMVYLVYADDASVMTSAELFDLKPTEVCPVDMDRVSTVTVSIGEAAKAVSITDDGQGGRVYTVDGATADTEAFEEAFAAVTGAASSGSTHEGSVSDTEMTLYFKLKDEYTSGAAAKADCILIISSYDSVSRLVTFNGDSRLLVSKETAEAMESAVKAAFGMDS